MAELFTEGRWPTPEEFIAGWEQSTPEQRLARAEQCIKNAQVASMCSLVDHEFEIARLRGELAHLEAYVRQRNAEVEGFDQRGRASHLRAIDAPTEATGETWPEGYDNQGNLKEADRG